MILIKVRLYCTIIVTFCMSVFLSSNNDHNDGRYLVEIGK